MGMQKLENWMLATAPQTRGSSQHWHSEPKATWKWSHILWPLPLLDPSQVGLAHSPNMTHIQSKRFQTVQRLRKMPYALHTVGASVCAPAILHSLNRNTGYLYHCYFNVAQATSSHLMSQSNRKMQLKLSLEGKGVCVLGGGGWGMVLLSRLWLQRFLFFSPLKHGNNPHGHWAFWLLER